MARFTRLSALLLLLAALPAAAQQRLFDFAIALHALVSCHQRHAKLRLFGVIQKADPPAAVDPRLIYASDRIVGKLARFYRASQHARARK
jgi:hypothetical protein